MPGMESSGFCWAGTGFGFAGWGLGCSGFSCCGVGAGMFIPGMESPGFCAGACCATALAAEIAHPHTSKSSNLTNLTRLLPKLNEH
jgi:hypothetical protein